VWVVSGDYKTEQDQTCAPFEPLRCNTFITESTFGLPIYHWPLQSEVFAEINRWWKQNQAAGRASLVLGYALGKIQRVLSGLDSTIGEIFLHGAGVELTNAYREEGVNLPPTALVSDAPKGHDWSRDLILAPPSAAGTPWVRRFKDHSTAFVSGWMLIRGTRRRRSVDQGFVLSDHADWPSLLKTIGDTGAEKVLVTHGYTSTLVRYLQEQGLDARVLATQWDGEQDAE
jgi:putative mRNA 3-end processing factor